MIKKIILYLILFSSIPLMAHEGVSYSILSDAPLGANTLSIWTDPHLDEGLFSLFISGDNKANYTVEVLTNPVKDPTHQLKAIAKLISNASERATYKVELPFDRDVMWNVEFVFKQNGQIISTLKREVQVVAPGPNKFEFALYFMPFLLMGFILFKVHQAKLKKSTFSPS